MIMLGIENMGEAPFHTVYLHGLITDRHGAKMSKSKGNVLDPLELVEKYGSYALRFALTTGNSPGNDMRLSDQRLEGSRNFANKLWNAARFVISNLEEAQGLDGWENPAPIHRHDRWIVSRFNRVARTVEARMEEYQFGEAQRAIYDFLWSEYCDWYIEMSKIRMRGGWGWGVAMSGAGIRTGRSAAAAASLHAVRHGGDMVDAHGCAASAGPVGPRP